MRTSSCHAYDVIRLYYGPTGSFNSFIPYPYHTPGGAKIFLIEQCMIHYWAVIYYTWLYSCTWSWGIDSGVCSLHFEYIVSFSGLG